MKRRQRWVCNRLTVIGRLVGQPSMPLVILTTNARYTHPAEPQEGGAGVGQSIRIGEGVRHSFT